MKNTSVSLFRQVLDLIPKREFEVESKEYIRLFLDGSELR